MREPRMIDTVAAEKKLYGFQKDIDNLLPPTKKQESYRYFPLAKLSKVSGAFEEAKVSYNAISNVEIESFEEAYENYKFLLEASLKSCLDKEEDFFAHKALKRFTKGLFISLEEGHQEKETLTIKTSWLEKLSTQSECLLYFHLEENAHLNVRLEIDTDQSFEKVLTRVIVANLAKGATLKIESNFKEEKNLWQFDYYRVSCKEDANFEFLSKSFGSLAIRQDFFVELQEETAQTALKGLSILDKGKSAFNHVEVKHLAENCLSDQHFKQVIYDQGLGVFDGKIFVDPIAQKTNAYQLCNSLTIGDKAKAFAKPNLEIFADDVKASHGATFSRLKEEDLFYLLSRGISKPVATKLLIEGFCQEIENQLSENTV